MTESQFPSQEPNRDPLSLEELLDDMFENYPEGVDEMLAQQEQRARSADDIELVHSAQELRELIDKRRAGETTEEDERQIRILRTEVWQLKGTQLDREDQITKDDQ